MAEGGMWWPPHSNTACTSFWMTMFSMAAHIAIWGLHASVTMWPVNIVFFVAFFHGMVCQWSHASFCSTRKDIDKVKKLKYSYKRV